MNRANHMGREIADFSSDFSGLRKSINSELSEGTYVSLRQSLKTRFVLVWLDLGLTHLLFFGSLYGAAVGKSWIQAPMWATAIGLTLHRLSLFLHEAAHFNVGRSKRTNDYLADVLVSPFVLTSIGAYRPGHMLHHRHLGTASDPERSYQHPLNPRFLISGLVGLRVIEVIRSRESENTVQRSLRDVAVPVIGVVIYATLLTWGLIRSNWQYSVALVAGVMSVFPLIGSLRQLLEHRADRDHFLSPSGSAVTRSFPTAPLGWLLGAAGFNRHLAHHWDPGISYTRLRQLEKHLMNTSAESILEARRNGYLVTFLSLWRPR